MNRHARVKWIWRWLIVGLLIAGGGSLANAQSAAAAQETVENFLSAWNALDYAAMYSYLSPQSQQRYPQQVFQARYEAVANTIGLTGLTFTVQQVRLQGASAAVTYDVALETAIFGQIIDPGRTMRLVLSSDERWGIAWSTMDIFDMLAGDSRLITSGLPRSRAPIYDRSGQPLAADGGAVVGMFARKENMPDVTACIRLLGEAGRLSVNRLTQLFNSYNPETLFFIGSIDGESYTAYRDRLISVCAVEEGFNATSQMRLYYGGNAVTHVTGYIGPIPAEQLAAYERRGYSAGDLVGQLGIELVYEETLAGQAERVLRIVEPGGAVLRELAGTAGTPASPVMLTIDRRLQLITAQAVSDAYNYATTSWGRPDIATGAAAVVLDVNTGAILAMVSYPLVDPAIFNPAAPIVDRGVAVQQVASDPRRPLINRVTQEQYFPGSVYKIITLAAALNEGIVSPTDIFDCQLEWEGQDVGDTLPVRTDWRVIDGLEAAGEVTPAQALMASCNPFFWQHGGLLAQQRGYNILVDYSRRMGMGRTYTVNQIWPGVEGVLGTPTSADVVINSAIGQTPVAIPPLQMAVVVAAVANGGTIYNPYLVQQVGGIDGAPQSFTASPEIIGQFDFNPGVLETIHEGMCGVTTNDDLGTAVWVFEGIPYTVCGKTGTAQAGLYPNAWFVAFTPAVNPQLAIVVMVESSREGSEVAAPIVRRILDNYYNVPRADFPFFWTQEYVPLQIPEGSTAG